ncbi:DUF3575 domain-containing protein [Dysgonomonas macrotermitis]|uniref:DUF3575 domain-containing protein n=1 Tax=Dysgonomonas macrotermitis TaxID=1346286 RepID=A0A1M5JNE8_9BACT|nr:DUF3575 domain-containing protein [Dysgonomonas macrotermitis]SHG41513.1 Protein of unknown function [Dysgonomonas macrotermitis]
MKKNIFTCALMTFFCFCASQLQAQSYSLGANIPAWGTATINAEISMALDRKWSLHLPVYYNPFVFKDNKKLQNFTLMPGARYWLLESYVNGFIGVNAIGSKYHISWKDSRYEGVAFGMGVSMGYAWLLSPRWNLEIEGGAGLVRADYTEYECQECGRQKREHSRWVAVPNRLALSFIYLF